ncbi:MAG: hypothetical protein IJ717_00960 [Treponema sp.]|nr:hypothetical protein [Treponema sp.]
MSCFNFVGVGKIILKTFEHEEYNIPHLHCLINKTDDGFEVINLEFGLVTFDKNAEEAVSSLVRMLIEYIKRTINDLGFKTLIDVVSRKTLESYWAEYRRLEFSLAETKNDVGHQVIDRIKKEAIEDFKRQYGIETVVKFSVVGEKAA